jgi:hypothetical protein
MRAAAAPDRRAKTPSCGHRATYPNICGSRIENAVTYLTTVTVGQSSRCTSDDRTAIAAAGRQIAAVASAAAMR